MKSKYVLSSILGILVVLSAVSCSTGPKGTGISSPPQENELSPADIYKTEPLFFAIPAAENSPMPGNTPEVPSIPRSQSGRSSPSPGSAGSKGTLSPPLFSTDSSSLAAGNAGVSASKTESPTGIADGLETPDVPGIPSLPGNTGKTEAASPPQSLTMTSTPSVPDIGLGQQASLSPQAVTEKTSPPSSSPTVDKIILSAQYQVQPWGISMDCFWNIARKPWVYGDPTKWVLLYYANISKLPSPENPDMIPPGLILDIPSIGNEVRQGIGNAEGSPASSRR